MWETFVSRLTDSAVPSVPGRQNAADGELPAHRCKQRCFPRTHRILTQPGFLPQMHTH